jgi:hypothetical protein
MWLGQDPCREHNLAAGRVAPVAAPTACVQWVPLFVFACIPGMLAGWVGWPTGLVVC